ncbi:MAG TPA: VOC family protein [Actinomycetota bacterium]|nr:VOC family protein [Actinomycetota bacterium]
MPSLDYVILYVDDLDRSLAFYRDLLGVVGTRRSDTYAELVLSNCRLGFLDRRAAPELLGRETLGSGAELLFLVESVDQEMDRLVRAGVRILTGPVDRPWGHRTVHLEDPDGHVVELAEEIPRSS